MITPNRVPEHFLWEKDFLCLTASLFVIGCGGSCEPEFLIMLEGAFWGTGSVREDLDLGLGCACIFVFVCLSNRGGGGVDCEALCVCVWGSASCCTPNNPSLPLLTPIYITLTHAPLL